MKAETNARLLSCLGALSIMAIVVSGCANESYRPNSPDVEYKKAVSHKSLQLPPGVNQVSKDEQYVVPEINGKIGRSSVLPSAENVRFVRDGQLSWLEIGVPANEIWGQVLLFLRQQGMEIDTNEPTAGIVTTKWSEKKQKLPSQGVLQKLLGGWKSGSAEQQLQRYSLRLERASQQSSRLFATYQHISKASVANKPDDLINEDPRLTAELLSRFMVFIGVNQQRARDILNQAEAAAIYTDIQLAETVENESYLLMWKDYPDSFESTQSALRGLEFEIGESNRVSGFIQVTGKADYFIQFFRLNTGAIAVTATDFKGRVVTGADSKSLMQALQNKLQSTT